MSLFYEYQPPSTLETTTQKNLSLPLPTLLLPLPLSLTLTLPTLLSSTRTRSRRRRRSSRRSSLIRRISHLHVSPRRSRQSQTRHVRPAGQLAETYHQPAHFLVLVRAVLEADPRARVEGFQDQGCDWRGWCCACVCICCC